MSKQTPVLQVGVFFIQVQAAEESSNKRTW
jgi:hypothetical protein